MRYFIAFFSILLLLTFFLLSGAALAGKRVHMWSEGDPPPIALKIARAAPPPPRMAPGWGVPSETLRDVTLEVTMTDISDYLVHLDPVAPAHYFRAIVLDAEGKPVAETRSFAAQKKALKSETENPEGSGAAREQAMKDPLAEWRQKPPTLRELVKRSPLDLWPRESHTFIYALSSLYDMSKPGIYKVRIELDLPVDLGKGTVSSNTLEVTVEAPPPDEEEQRDRKQMVEDSLKEFKGSCPCPYSFGEDNATCGDKSGYKPGRTSPLCYESDATPAMLAEYRKQVQNYAPPGAPFTVTIRSDGPVFRKDVTIIVRLTNNSGKTIRIRQIEPAYDYRGIVLDAEGRQVPDTEYFAREKSATKEQLGSRWEAVHGYSRSIDLKLTPHNTMEFPLNLGTYYDMSKPGKYTVQLAHDMPPELGKGKVLSNKLEITVALPPPAEAKTSEPEPANPGFTPEEEDRMNKKVIVENSIKAFKGSCPCPYSVDTSGAACEKKSAYKPGRVPPLCFESDVTAEMLAAYKTQYQNYAPPGYVPGQPRDPEELAKQEKFVATCMKRVRQETAVRDFAVKKSEFSDDLDFTGGKDVEDLTPGILVFQQCMIEHGASPR